MSMSKQSSIEWLDVELTSLHFDYLTGQVNNSEFNERKKLIMEEAKSMHKEEIITTWHKGYDNLSPMIDEDNCGDKYYKETFNK
jgi:hypothetical protein